MKSDIPIKNHYYSKKISNKSSLLFAIILILINLYIYTRGDNIIVVIFAGRQKYLEILMAYIQYLKFHKKISEIHFWQFTNSKSDEKYLESLSNLHKTNGHFSYYRNIYPVLYNNNYFIININFQKKGAFILINDKYEIAFNIINNKDIIISLRTSKTIFYENQVGVYNKNIFLTYIIKITNYNLFIEGNQMSSIKSMIDDNNFTSIKIKSEIDGETDWNYEESINKDIKLYDTAFRKMKYWYETYKFYLNYNFDILIKMDDDISFIDVSRFQEFINFIKSSKKNITIPNLVNHAVSLYYNNKEGLIPDHLIKKIYRKKHYSRDLYDYFKDGEEADKMHEYFLKNINKFITNNMNPIQLNRQKPSICMFGITKESYNYVYDPKVIWPNSDEPKDYKFKDERYTYRLSNNYIYPRFVCIHYSFGPQRKNGLDEKFLDNYKNISKKYLLKQ
jgi:hypothetical protein